MNRIASKLMLGFALGVISMPVLAQMATPTNFTPVPVREDAQLRLFVNLNGNTMFNAGSVVKSGNLVNTLLNLGLIYNVGAGLDVGFGARRVVRADALQRSLIATLVGIAIGATLTGGLASPLVPMLFAPIGVGFAAFGRTRASAASREGSKSASGPTKG